MTAINLRWKRKSKAFFLRPLWLPHCLHCIVEVATQCSQAILDDLICWQCWTAFIPNIRWPTGQFIWTGIGSNSQKQSYGGVGHCLTFSQIVWLMRKKVRAKRKSTMNFIFLEQITTDFFLWTVTLRAFWSSSRANLNRQNEHLIICFARHLSAFGQFR